MEETKRRRFIIRAVLEGEVDVQEEPGNVLTVSSNVAASAYEGNTEYTGLVIEGDIFIGNKAFKNCTGLTFISAPSLQRIYSGYYGASVSTFEGCTGLTRVAFPSHGNYGTGQYAFKNCSSLYAIDFKYLKNISSYTFEGCSALRIMVLRGENVTLVSNGFQESSLGGMFTNSSESVVYVPSSQITNYQANNDWAAFVNNGGIIAAIEGSEFEHKYVDGTPIA